MPILYIERKIKKTQVQRLGWCVQNETNCGEKSLHLTYYLSVSVCVSVLELVRDQEEDNTIALPSVFRQTAKLSHSTTKAHTHLAAATYRDHTEIAQRLDHFSCGKYAWHVLSLSSMFRYTEITYRIVSDVRSIMTSSHSQYNSLFSQLAKHNSKW